MSNIPLGKDGQLMVGLTPTAQATITGLASGTSSVGKLERISSTPMPGGAGVLASLPGRHEVHDFTIVTQSDPVHDPVFRRANCRRVWCTWRRRGVGAGLPETTFQGVCTTTLTLDYGTNLTTWTITIAIDGLPVESVQ